METNFLKNSIKTSSASYCQIRQIIEKYSRFCKRTCEANAAGENSQFIFRVCVKFVPLYRYKPSYVVLHMAVKEFFEIHF